MSERSAGSERPDWVEYRKRHRKETPTRLEHVAQSLAAQPNTNEPGLVENFLHLRRDEQASVVLWACQVI